MISDAVSRNLATKNSPRFLPHLVSFAQSFGIKTVARGVDTKQDALILRQEGVGFLQGEYFGGPTFARPWIVLQEAMQEPPAALREGCQ